MSSPAPMMYPTLRFGGIFTIHDCGALDSRLEVEESADIGARDQAVALR